MRPQTRRSEYFIFGDEGLTPLPREGLERRIWEEQDLSIGDEEGGEAVSHSSAFFVGTRKEHRKARRLAPHLLPTYPE